MPILLLVAVILAIYAVAYLFYGRNILQEKVVRASPERETPAIAKFDGVDYVPAHRFVLFGHHFASIAGAGPIVGPAIAMAYGWLLPLVWVLFGNVFMGAVHDYLSLMASVRYGGISIVSVGENLMGRKARYLFLIYVLFTLILVYAAFASIAASLFARDPRVATLSILFMPLALLLGIMMYRMGLGMGPSTVITVVLVIAAFVYSYNHGIVIGTFDPSLPPGEGGWVAYHRWVIILGLYALLAASLPVWYLLQPRDYLNAYILWTGLGLAAIAAILLGTQSLKGPAYTSFQPNIIAGQPTPFWPAIPLIIACGSLSGFHSLVASGTTSKQLASELDALFVGYGAMLLEGALSGLAVIIPISFAWNAPELIQKGVIENNMLDLAAVPRYAVGYGYTLAKTFEMFGVGFDTGYSFFTLFASLMLSMYVLTTLDTGTRLARFAWQELFDWLANVDKNLYSIVTNKWVSSLAVVIIGSALAYPVLEIGAGYKAAYNVVWPAFAGANQMLAAIALLTSALWVYGVLNVRGGTGLLILLPSLFLWVTVTAGLTWWLMVILPVLPAIQQFGAGSMILFTLLLSLLLFALFIINFNKLSKQAGASQQAQA
ncbi:carbon starvation protein A [Aeropyrum pernix K1]|uniref:Carbon starvation protein A n=2 Tax=Aeropyrum pernix TaxID=56636 RepID=Q9Y9X7_AERPE|nr:carbon starvation protein A [Aeropyrum pernix]BAA81173.2 carbon starvation protein A [Aeropyrum pernix K1]